MTTLCPPGGQPFRLLLHPMAINASGTGARNTSSNGPTRPHPPQVATATSVQGATQGAKCNLTTWSADGFGHQLAAILSCKLLALSKPHIYRYVPSEHTEIEHAPVNAHALLEFLDTMFLDLKAKMPPVNVPPRAYHRTCDGGQSRRLPPCIQGQLTICDNCFRMFDPSAHPNADARAADELRRQLAAASGVGDGSLAAAAASCPRRPVVCVHQRGLGSPGAWNDTRHTSARAERESLWRRSYPPSWWHRAIETALATGGGAGENLMVVHTNNLALANGTFGPLDSNGGRMSWRPSASHHARNRTSAPREASFEETLAVQVFGPNVPLLMMMHELIFCCETLVVGVSALSSVIAWARRPKPTVAHSSHDIHLGFPYTTLRSASR